MKKLIISKNRTKCRRCHNQTHKIEYKKGPDPDMFFVENNQLICAYCGYIYTGELLRHKKTELEVSEEKYEEMLNQHKEYLKKRKV